MRFRPCIDLHQGKVKQIVGSSLTDSSERLVTNFVTDLPASHYAGLYKRDNLRGGHLIMLGPGNEAAAREALGVFPGGLQAGGGISSHNAKSYLDAGASHVIVTSFVFNEGRIHHDRLLLLVKEIGRHRLVLDLSCRLAEGKYLLVTDRWQTLTEIEISEHTLSDLSGYCDEFLVHAADVEGLQSGIDGALVEMLAKWSPIPVTYAGGVRSIEDLESIRVHGRGRVDATVGSALDIFGGPLPYAAVVEWNGKVLTLPSPPRT